MKILALHSATDTQGQAGEIEWQDLIDLARDPEVRDTKDGAAIVFAELSGKRSRANVVSVSALVYDLDSLSGDAVAELWERLDTYRKLLHTTHSHTPEKPKFRLILPLTRPASPEEFFALWDTFSARFCIDADRQCRDVARLYYLPSHPPSAAEWGHEHTDGQAVDVDFWIKRSASPIQKQTTPSGIEAIAVPSVELSDVREALRKSLTRYASDARHDAKRQVVQAVLDGKPLADEGARDVSLNRICSILASYLPLGTPWEAVAIVLAPSIRAMPGTPSELAYFEQKAAKCYARAMVRAGEAAKVRDADRIFAEEYNKSRALGHPLPSRDRATSGPEEKQEQNTSNTNEVTAREAEDEALVLDRNGKVVNCPQNIALILAKNPAFSSLRFNTLTKSPEFASGPFAGVPLSTLETHVCVWLDRHAGLSIRRGSEVRPYLLLHAQKNPFNPVSAYLEKCAETWDGTPRVDAFLQRYFGAAIDASQSAEYVQAVSRIALLSAVKRGLEPGCYVKTVPVFDSPQDYKKSSAIKALFGEFFSDAELQLNSKDAAMIAAACWCVEIAEWKAFSGRNSDEVKAFISRNSDMLRPPYGAVVEKYQRQAVFWGTVNPEGDGTYLNDATGNSRFLPVRLATPCDVAGIEADRDQIFGEAVHRIRAGEKHWIEDEAVKALVVKAAEERNQEPAEVAPILDWFVSLEQRPELVRTHDVAKDALWLGSDKITTGKLRYIAQALKKLGFTQVRVTQHGQSLRYFKAPDSLLTAAKKSRAKVEINGKASHA